MKNELTIRQRFVLAAMNSLIAHNTTGNFQGINVVAVGIADLCLDEEFKTRKLKHDCEECRVAATKINALIKEKKERAKKYALMDELMDELNELNESMDEINELNESIDEINDL